jgi:AraC-like DNA-binding protein
MSPKYFSSFFSKTFTISFVQFINNYRIDQACILLKTTDLPILEIAFEVGFENISYFTKKFKELKGYTPKEYRKKNAPVMPQEN